MHWQRIEGNIRQAERNTSVCQIIFGHFENLKAPIKWPCLPSQLIFVLYAPGVHIFVLRRIEGFLNGPCFTLGNGIGPKGAEYLAAAVQVNSTLLELDLCGMPLSVAIPTTGIIQRFDSGVGSGRVGLPSEGGFAHFSLVRSANFF